MKNERTTSGKKFPIVIWKHRTQPNESRLSFGEADTRKIQGSGQITWTEHSAYFVEIPTASGLQLEESIRALKVFTSAAATSSAGVYTLDPSEACDHINRTLSSLGLQYKWIGSNATYTKLPIAVWCDKKNPNRSRITIGASEFDKFARYRKSRWFEGWRIDLSISNSGARELAQALNCTQELANKRSMSSGMVFSEKPTATVSTLVRVLITQGLLPPNFQPEEVVLFSEQRQTKKKEASDLPNRNVQNQQAHCGRDLGVRVPVEDVPTGILGESTRPMVYASELGSDASIQSGKYVYVMSNRDWDYYKIGYSDDPDRRARELRSTNTAHPNKVEFFVETNDAPELEGRVHRQLQAYRVVPDREFFKVELPEIVAAIRQQAIHTGHGRETLRAKVIDGMIPTKEQWEAHQEKLRADRKRAAEDHAKKQQEQLLLEQRLNEKYERYCERLAREYENDLEIAELRERHRFMGILVAVGLGIALTGVGVPLGVGVAAICGWLAARTRHNIDQKSRRYRPQSKREFAKDLIK